MTQCRSASGGGENVRPLAAYVVSTGGSRVLDSG